LRSGQLHATVILFREKEVTVPSQRGSVRIRLGLNTLDKRKISCAYTGIEPLFVDNPARIRLSYTSSVSKVVCSHSESVWGNGDIAALILNLGTRWRWVISFPARLLYMGGMSFRCRFSKGLTRPCSRSGCFQEEKNLFSLHEVEPRSIGCAAYSQSLSGLTCERPGNWF
jgi:hypothetical protein